mmetsp:Transcript_18130/g.32438  ORF Transcript_18130/g.32438 Transcript_18130/m.32438 type:complete len:113 (+) Transcript_18130:3427-3765(+)
MAYDETGYSAPNIGDITCKSLLASLKSQVEDQLGQSLTFLECIEYSTYDHYGTNFNIKAAASDSNKALFLKAYKPPLRAPQLVSLTRLHERSENINAPVDLRQVYRGLSPKF